MRALRRDYPALVPSSPNELSRQHGPRGLCIMGSTGSIGCSTLELVRRFPAEFKVVALAAGRQAGLLGQQIREFRPSYAYLADPAGVAELGDIGSTELIVDGHDGGAELVAVPGVELVVAAIVGSAGLASTMRAISLGKIVALANKESLVMAGRFVAATLAEAQAKRVGTGAALLPIDSEHASLFQLIEGRSEVIASMTLTASGGPFLDTPVEALKEVTPAQAVRHPRWSMGAKISIDSATLMNKALELIEACWLFGVSSTKLKVLVHPQSIVHALVEFADGTQVAHLSVADMQGPISFVLRYPAERLPGVLAPLELARIGCLEFRALDENKFRAVALAKQALDSDDDSCAVLSVVNEEAVQRFMQGGLRFDQIVPLVQRGLERFAGRRVGSIEELGQYEAELRAWAKDQTF